MQIYLTQISQANESNKCWRFQIIVQPTPIMKIEMTILMFAIAKHIKHFQMQSNGRNCFWNWKCLQFQDHTHVLQVGCNINKESWTQILYGKPIKILESQLHNLMCFFTLFGRHAKGYFTLLRTLDPWYTNYVIGREVKDGPSSLYTRPWGPRNLNAWKMYMTSFQQ